MGCRNFAAEMRSRDDKADDALEYVRSVYEEAKKKLESVVFEIILEPKDTEPGVDASERHIINLSDCVSDVNEDPERDLSIQEMFVEIGKLRDYKTLLEYGLQSIECNKEKLKTQVSVKLVRILEQPDQELESDTESNSQAEDELESESEGNSPLKTDFGHDHTPVNSPPPTESGSEADWESVFVSDQEPEEEPVAKRHCNDPFGDGYYLH